MRTALCDLLGIDVAIVQGPMAGGWTTPALVAEVCEAGGLGTLAGGRVAAGDLRSQIEETRRRTRRPFGINFLIPAPEAERTDDPAVPGVLARFRERLGLPEPPPPTLPPASVDEALEIALAARVPVISFAMGSPRAYVERVHAAGAIVVATVTTVDEALEVAAAGADVVVAQGSEAGGHRSTFAPAALDAMPLVGTMALMPAVVDAVARPVLAAGGIMDGRGIVAALALGAAGVQLGTRFLLATESGAPPSYRRQLLRADETSTFITDVFSGRPARGLRNAFARAFEESGARPLPYPRQGASALDIYRASLADDGEWATLFAGQGLRLAGTEQPAAAIVRELVAEVRSVRDRLAG
ncbi:MAG TPA: nitronate monooxygenase [Gemmatimonadales bacterium]|nr:nitronate monooxygenase [Gemmatimonadales bacterium]